jgi:putative endonuclease
VTNDLIRRVFEHKSKFVEGFTAKYDVVKLVYFEQFDDPENAIKREKRLKKWPRAWKVSLIEKQNPTWSDHYPGIAAGGGWVPEYWIARSSRATTVFLWPESDNTSTWLPDRPPSRTMTSE